LRSAAAAAPGRFMAAAAPVRTIAGWVKPRAACAAAERQVVAMRWLATTTTEDGGGSEEGEAAEVDLDAALAAATEEEDDTPAARTAVDIPDLTNVAPVDFVAKEGEQTPTTLGDAVEMLSAGAKWDQSLALSMKISTYDKNKKKGKPRDAFRDIVMLPHPYRSGKKVLVFARGADADAALAAGAAIVGERELVAELTSGAIKADVVLASAELAKELKPDARYLRQLMPTPRKGTVSDDVEALVKSHLQGMPFRSDITGYLNIGVGRTSQSIAQIEENMQAIFEVMEEHRNSTRAFVLSATIATTQGKGIPLELKSLENLP